MEQDDEDVHYAVLPDDIITAEIKADAIKVKEYFMYPSQLLSISLKQLMRMTA